MLEGLCESASYAVRRLTEWLGALAVFALVTATGMNGANATSSAQSAPPVRQATITARRILVPADSIAIFGPESPTVLPVELPIGDAALVPIVDAPPAPPTELCPVDGPVRFGSTYGEARSGGRRHVGVDLTAPIGTPTVAPVAGTVRYDRDSTGGLSWNLSGDNGIFYYGTHLSRFGSRSGHVEAGEVIGYVGQSGNASIPHLHFEIHPRGPGSAAIDPTPFAYAHCSPA